MTDSNSGDIVDQQLAAILGEKYLAYALSTIMSRSLPDVRDGLKPVHRRLIYAMHQLRLDPTAGFSRSHWVPTFLVYLDECLGRSRGSLPD